MTLRRRLERADSKANLDRNRPAVDCITIIGSFSETETETETEYGDGHVKPCVDTVLVWSPCGWHSLAPTDRDAHKRISNAP